MKKYVLVLSIIFGIGTAYALPMTCQCTKGKMTVSVGEGGVEMSCSDGGKVSCEID